MAVDAVFVQFPLDNRVVIPEDKCISIGLVLDNAELGIYIVLHLISVTVQMIGRNVHQYGDISMEFVHVIQLETA